MKKLMYVVGALAVLAAAQPASAQVTFGPHIAWGEDTDLGVGGRVLFDLAGPLGITDGFFQDLAAQAGATYYFLDCPSEVDCSYLQADFDAIVPFPIDATVTPFAGAGLHYARSSVEDFSDSEIGLNILGGIFFPIGGLDGFAEAKLGLAGAEQLSLSAGILFGGN